MIYNALIRSAAIIAFVILPEAARAYEPATHALISREAVLSLALFDGKKLAVALSLILMDCQFETVAVYMQIPKVNCEQF